MDYEHYKIKLNKAYNYLKKAWSLNNEEWYSIMLISCWKEIFIAFNDWRVIKYCLVKIYLQQELAF